MLLTVFGFQGFNRCLSEGRHTSTEPPNSTKLGTRAVKKVEKRYSTLILEWTRINDLILAQKKKR